MQNTNSILMLAFMLSQNITHYNNPCNWNSDKWNKQSFQVEKCFTYIVSLIVSIRRKKNWVINSLLFFLNPKPANALYLISHKGIMEVFLSTQIA